eukprot:TRINITY_DN149_c2_g1_i1.p1 TRINITY_DN149_c2_g1~~TRINITY_DN149_c2_g1_i1.p1  ORF type:complete len:234 (-),score=39.45 TRINITY_DN149_c2_g1_i1:6-707(-)
MEKREWEDEVTIQEYDWAFDPVVAEPYKDVPTRNQNLNDAQAHRLFHIGEYQKALDIFLSGLPLVKKLRGVRGGSLLHSIALCYVHLDNFEKARETCLQIISLENPNGSHKGHSYVFFLLGFCEFRAGSLEECVLWLFKSLGRHRRHIDTWVLLAQVYSLLEGSAKIGMCCIEACRRLIGDDADDSFVEQLMKLKQVEPIIKGMESTRKLSEDEVELIRKEEAKKSKVKHVKS